MVIASRCVAKLLFARIVAWAHGGPAEWASADIRGGPASVGGGASAQTAPLRCVGTERIAQVRQPARRQWKPKHRRLAKLLCFAGAGWVALAAEPAGKAEAATARRRLVLF